jgi:hypothetical protein
MRGAPFLLGLLACAALATPAAAEDAAEVVHCWENTSGGEWNGYCGVGGVVVPVGSCDAGPQMCGAVKDFWIAYVCHTVNGLPVVGSCYSV